MSVVKETKSEIKNLFVFHHSTPRMSKNILMSHSIVIKIETAKEIHKFGELVREGIKEKEVFEDRVSVPKTGWKSINRDS